MFATLNVYLKNRFERLAADCDKSPKLILTRLDALASRIVGVAKGLAKRTSALYPSDVYAKILNVISLQAKVLSE